MNNSGVEVGRELGVVVSPTKSVLSFRLSLTDFVPA